jgi:hypothetical protein
MIGGITDGYKRARLFLIDTADCQPFADFFVMITIISEIRKLSSIESAKKIRS